MKNNNPRRQLYSIVDDIKGNNYLKESQQKYAHNNSMMGKYNTIVLYSNLIAPRIFAMPGTLIA
jgi:hypothetical protein